MVRHRESYRTTEQSEKSRVMVGFRMRIVTLSTVLNINMEVLFLHPYQLGGGPKEPPLTFHKFGD